VLKAYFRSVSEQVQGRPAGAAKEGWGLPFAENVRVAVALTMDQTGVAAQPENFDRAFLVLDALV